MIIGVSIGQVSKHWRKELKKESVSFHPYAWQARKVSIYITFWVLMIKTILETESFWGIETVGTMAPRTLHLVRDIGRRTRARARARATFSFNVCRWQYRELGNCASVLGASPFKTIHLQYSSLPNKLHTKNQTT